MIARLRVRSGFVDTSDGQVRYFEAGAGPAVVLLPHGGRSARMYRQLVPILARTRHVIALDPPGAGESFIPAEEWALPRLAEPLHRAAIAIAGAPFALYGMNGGNKLGVAMCDAHPESVRAFVFAGLTHSIVVSNARRAQTLGAHPSVRATLASPSSATGWRTRLAAAAVPPDVAEMEWAMDEMLDRIQSIRYRHNFYRAVTAYDLETPLRATQVPIGVLEFTTPEEDEHIGRQGSVTAEAIGAEARAAMALASGESFGLEGRADELGARILGLVTEIEE